MQCDKCEYTSILHYKYNIQIYYDAFLKYHCNFKSTYELSEKPFVSVNIKQKNYDYLKQYTSYTKYIIFCYFLY